MKFRSPLIKNVLTPLAKSVLIPLGLITAAHAGVHKTVLRSGICGSKTTLINGRYHASS